MPFCPWQVPRPPTLWSSGRGVSRLGQSSGLFPLSHGLGWPPGVSIRQLSHGFTWICPFPQGPETPPRFLLLHR